MNNELINGLVGAVVLDESLLGEVVGGHDCTPTTTSSCPPATRPIVCGGGTTPDYSCMPPGMQCY